jgi:hypothetical protein
MPAMQLMAGKVRVSCRASRSRRAAAASTKNACPRTSRATLSGVLGLATALASPRARRAPLRPLRDATRSTGADASRAPQVTGAVKSSFAGAALRPAAVRVVARRAAAPAPTAELERLRLHNLSSEEGSRHRKARVGRGNSAGQARARQRNTPEIGVAERTPRWQHARWPRSRTQRRNARCCAAPPRRRRHRPARLPGPARVSWPLLGFFARCPTLASACFP